MNKKQYFRHSAKMLLMLVFMAVLSFYPLQSMAWSLSDFTDINLQIRNILDLALKLQVKIASMGQAGSINYDCSALPTKNLQLHDVSPSVKEMAKVLNSSSDTTITSFGPGSPGSESNYFGILTYGAVVKFQEKYRNDILTPAGLKRGSGFVGTTTRIKLKEICLDLVNKAAQDASNVSSTQDLSSADILDSTANASNSLSFYNNYYRNRYKTYETQTTKPTSTASTSTLSKTSTSTSASTTSTPPKTSSGSSSTTSSTTKTTTTTTQPTQPATQSSGSLMWGAYVGSNSSDLSNFESLVGKQVNIQAVFWNLTDSFPSNYKSSVGAKGKTLLVFLEPAFGYDSINTGNYDATLKKFASDAKTYGYPVIIVPFNEMNLNEENWGYGVNGNTASKFKSAWIRIHDMYLDVPNVKFAIAYNNVSIPNISGNKFADYYPGSAYVDYVGVDGFNFGTPWQSFGTIFDSSVKELEAFNKPMLILATASSQGSQKPTWIKDGLGTRIKTYSKVVGWLWFNENKEADWRVNSDSASLEAFKSILP